MQQFPHDPPTRTPGHHATHPPPHVVQNDTPTLIIGALKETTRHTPPPHQTNNPGNTPGTRNHQTKPPCGG